jgi:ATP-dependent Lon protease
VQINMQFKRLKNRYAMIALRGMVVFPYMVLHFDVGREKSILSLEKALAEKQRIFLVAQKDINVEEPVEEDVYDIGTVCEIKQVLKMPGDAIRVLVEGITRGRILEYDEDDENGIHVIVEELPTSRFEEDIEVLAYKRAIVEAFEKYARKSPKISSDAVASVKEIKSADKLADLVSSYVLFNTEDKQEVLQCIAPIDRLKKLIDILFEEIEIIDVENDIQRIVRKNIEKSQKEFYLREQVKVIQKELGEENGVMQEAKELRERLEQKALSEEAAKKCEKEIEKLEKMSQNSPEVNVIINYVDAVASLPWGELTEDNLDLNNVQTVLDEDHYGLIQVKERIIEYISVLKMKDEMKGPILCFIGPPGVGKTSIVKSIAKAIGREFVRMSLGGIRDEAEIRGHRRTYIGAIPGRIINSMKQAGTDNPVLLFDEIDKMASDFRGDPASAMLEVLDPEINATFRDHYISMAYDLSKVMFITTANSLNTIPKPLLDRMEVIHVSSYTYNEKLEIAKRHLVKKQALAHGLDEQKIAFEDEALEDIINLYTKESGVRSLEREIAAICRKVASELVKTGEEKIVVSKDKVLEYLKAPRFGYDLMDETDSIGVVNGLAWTQVGGETLKIEATSFDGSGKLKLTGMMGDVMKESAETGLSLIRSIADEIGVDADFHKKVDLHIHIPEGAIPKDGPSAGITMVTALTSVLSNRKVKRDIAMTGEVTLTGRVLKIGGLKEKSLAALRSGVNQIIIPKENILDVEDFAQEIKDSITFYPVSHIEEVLKLALI